MNNNNDIRDIKDDIINLLARHGELGDYIRDEEIRRKYKALTLNDEVSAEAARIQLAEDYFLSEKHIQTILYDKRKYDIKIIGNKANKVIVITEV
jgi:phosphoenolpyruvate-protein kinase (PTS system EI component)